MRKLTQSSACAQAGAVNHYSWKDIYIENFILKLKILEKHTGWKGLKKLSNCFVLSIWKLSLRKVKWIVHGHIAGLCLLAGPVIFKFTSLDVLVLHIIPILSPFFFFFQYLFTYLAGLSCNTLNVVPQPRIEPGSLALGAQSLSHWTTREVPLFPSFYCKRASPLKKEK